MIWLNSREGSISDAEVWQEGKAKKAGECNFVFSSGTAGFCLVLSDHFFADRSFDGAGGSCGESEADICRDRGFRVLGFASVSAVPAFLCGADLRYTGFFCNALEFREDYGRYPAGAGAVRHSRGMGLCQIPFPISQGIVLPIHCHDDDAISGYDAFGLSGDREDASDGHYGGGHSSRDFFYPSGLYCLPVFEEIPGELLEAARIDGAGEAEIFFRIGLPLGKSGIVSALVLQFLECWNMLEQPMVFLKTPSLRPLSMFQPQITWETAGAAFAASVFALLPAIWVFLAGHDFLEQGIQGYMSHSGQSPR